RRTHASWRAHDTTPVVIHRSPKRFHLVRGLVSLGLLTILSSCGSGDDGGAARLVNSTPTAAADESSDLAGTLRVGAIPDQDPERLQRTYGLLADHLATETGLDVEYLPVTDYQGAVSGFVVGDLDLVWFG